MKQRYASVLAETMTDENLSDVIYVIRPKFDGRRIGRRDHKGKQHRLGEKRAEKLCPHSDVDSRRKNWIVGFMEGWDQYEASKKKAA